MSVKCGQRQAGKGGESKEAFPATTPTHYDYLGSTHRQRNFSWIWIWIWIWIWLWLWFWIWTPLTGQGKKSERRPNQALGTPSVALVRSLVLSELCGAPPRVLLASLEQHATGRCETESLVRFRGRQFDRRTLFLEGPVTHWSKPLNRAMCEMLAGGESSLELSLRLTLPIQDIFGRLDLV